MGGTIAKYVDQKKNIIPDAVLLLQPTSPIRKINDILNAIKQVEGEDSFSIISVTKMREHPFECIEVNKVGWSYLSKPKNPPTGRQDYSETFFFIDGSFYFASVEFLKKYQTFIIENKTQYYLLNQRWAIDIDEKEDLIVAEALLSES